MKRMTAGDNLELPKHPSTAQHRRTMALGALLASIGVALAALGAPTFAPGAVLLGALFAWLGWRANRDTHVVQLNNLAYERLSRGDLDGAAALLGRAEKTAKGYPRRAIRLQQAVLALYRGDPESAVTAATDAGSGTASFLNGSSERRFQASALGVRALAQAAHGREADAERDADAATRAPSAGADAFGRAGLARMVLAAQKNDLNRLAALLRENGRTMQALLPRERALVRAFRRMVAAGGSVYRRPARRDEADGAAALRDWVSRVVPQAASFVEHAGVGTGGEVEVEAPTAVARRAVEEQRAAHAKAAGPSRARRALRRVVFWAAVVVLFWALLDVLTPTPGALDGESAPAPGLATDLGTWGVLFSAFAVIVMGLVGWRVYDANTSSARLAQADLLVARGQPDGAAAVYRSLVAKKSPVVKAAAHLGLAAVAEEHARFEDAMREVDAGIGVIEAHKGWRALASDILLPELHGMRAFLLAVGGRIDEANAELALLSREFPTYPFATRTRHRVRLVQALVTGDSEAAVAIARQRAPELPLSMRDELLADLVLATSGTPLPEGERERLEAELREDPVLARWMRAIAPGLSPTSPAQGSRVTERGEPADESAGEEDAAPYAAKA
jgi:hypothetical protein